VGLGFQHILGLAGLLLFPTLVGKSFSLPSPQVAYLYGITFITSGVVVILQAVGLLRLPDGRDPHRQLWLWHAGPAPLSLDELWRGYLARFDIEHAIRTLKGTLGLPAAKVRA
jgi:hypothetical protein